MSYPRSLTLDLSYRILITDAEACMERLTSHAHNQHAHEKGNKMAKIVRFHESGGPEVLKIEEGPAREPGTNAKLIKQK